MIRVQPGYLRMLHGRRVVDIEYDVCRSSATRRLYASCGPETTTSARLIFDRPPRDNLLYVIGNAVEPAEFSLPTTDRITRVAVHLEMPLYKLVNGYREWLIEPADINRLIERDKHACALRELAFWLTVPGPWQVWADRYGGTRFGDRENAPWPLPVHVHEAPLYGPVLPTTESQWPPGWYSKISGQDYNPHPITVDNHTTVLVHRWLALDHDSVAVCADARMERNLPVAPRLTVLGPKCVTCDGQAQMVEPRQHPEVERPFWPDCYACVEKRTFGRTFE